MVPLFREQIATGGPVTVTDKRMTRYFITLNEAAELIAQSVALTEGGDIFVLDMGEPVSILTLAENMIRLAGLRVRSPRNPQGDIEIVFSGIRAGEQLEESLHYTQANVTGTAHPRIKRIKRRGAGGSGMPDKIGKLRQVIGAGDADKVRQILFDHVRDNGGEDSRAEGTEYGREADDTRPPRMLLQAPEAGDDFKREYKD